MVKAATKSLAIAHGDKEMYDFEDTVGKRSNDEGWKDPKRVQKRRKAKKKIAQRRTAQLTNDKKGIGETQGKASKTWV